MTPREQTSQHFHALRAAMLASTVAAVAGLGVLVTGSVAIEPAVASVPALNPPTTAVLVPSAGSTLTGQSAVLDATASSSSSVISQVQFALTGGSYNQTVIGTATPTAYGYVLDWNIVNVAAGTYTLQSLATDGSGLSAYSAGVTITVSPTTQRVLPPSTAVVVPSSGATVGGTGALLDATASSASGLGITEVQFALTGGSYDQTVIGTAVPSAYGYLYSWNTTSVPDGTYTLQSAATDGAGLTAHSAGISIRVDNQPKTSVVVPATGTTVDALTTLDATASAPSGISITKVQFVLTGGAANQYDQTVIGTATATPFGYISSWVTPAVPDGTYTLQSVATDALGETSNSQPITITVQNNAITTVVVPTGGSTVSGNVVLDATASAPPGQGPITEVQFTAEGIQDGQPTYQVLGTATPTLYGWVFVLNTTSLPNGEYSLQSVATDAIGGGASNAVGITVDNNVVIAVPSPT
jgi:hypothetical protein